MLEQYIDNVMLENEFHRCKEMKKYSLLIWLVPILFFCSLFFSQEGYATSKEEQITNTPPSNREASLPLVEGSWNLGLKELPPPEKITKGAIALYDNADHTWSVYLKMNNYYEIILSPENYLIIDLKNYKKVMFLVKEDDYIINNTVSKHTILNDSQKLEKDIWTEVQFYTTDFVDTENSPVIEVVSQGTVSKSFNLQIQARHVRLGIEINQRLEDQSLLPVEGATFGMSNWDDLSEDSLGIAESRLIQSIDTSGNPYKKSVALFSDFNFEENRRYRIKQQTSPIDILDRNFYTFIYTKNPQTDYVSVKDFNVKFGLEGTEADVPVEQLIFEWEQEDYVYLIIQIENKITPLGLTVPERVNFGSYKIGSPNSKLYWNKEQQVIVKDTHNIGWDLSVTLNNTFNHDFDQYLYIDQTAVGTDATMLTAGTGTTEVSQILEGDQFLHINYSNVTNLRKDSARLEWTLTPSLKEVKE